MEKHVDLWSRYLKIFVIVSCYWVVSISTVFVNKTLLSGQRVPLEAPLFITWFQCVVSFLICATMSAAGGIYRVFTFPKGTPWRLDTFKKVVPLSMMFTLMIATNNLSLKYVSLSFYYLGRSLTTIFNVILSWVIMQQSTSPKCLACCASIILGFWLGVDQENVLGSFSLNGTIYGIIGSLVLALFSIYTKKTLPHVDQQVWLLTYSINAYAIFLFLPLMGLNGEIQVIWNYKHFNSWYFWTQMVISGVCGLAVGHLTSLQIKVTSPLTHNISGTAKACCQTVLATQWHHEAKNALWWVSNVIVLINSALYAWFKQMEMEQQCKKSDTQGDNPGGTIMDDQRDARKTQCIPPPQGSGYPVEKYSRIQVDLDFTSPTGEYYCTEINHKDTGSVEECSRPQKNLDSTGPQEDYRRTHINQDNGLVNENSRTQINQEDNGLMEDYSRTQRKPKDNDSAGDNSRTHLNQEDNGLMEDNSRTQRNPKDNGPAGDNPRTHINQGDNDTVEDNSRTQKLKG